MYIAAFVFGPLAALESALWVRFIFVPLAALESTPGSDFLPLPFNLKAVAPLRSRRKLPNFPVWTATKHARYAYF